MRNANPWTSLMRQSCPTADRDRSSASWLPWPFRHPKEAEPASPDNLAIAGPSEHQQGQVIGSEELQPLGRLCGEPQRDHGGNAVGELSGGPFERVSGRLGGLQDGKLGGSPSTVTYHVVGDTVVGCLPGYQPSPTAEQHAMEFVAWRANTAKSAAALQRVTPICQISTGCSRKPSEYW